MSYLSMHMINIFPVAQEWRSAFICIVHYLDGVIYCGFALYFLFSKAEEADFSPQIIFNMFLNFRENRTFECEIFAQYVPLQNIGFC